MKGSTLRKIFLIAFIAAYASATGAAAYLGVLSTHWEFFWTLIGCGLSVGAGEVVSVIVTGDTLSTNITRSWKAGGKQAITVTVMCVSLVLVMVFLGMHFFPWEWLVG